MMDTIEERFKELIKINLDMVTGIKKLQARVDWMEDMIKGLLEEKHGLQRKMDN